MFAHRRRPQLTCVEGPIASAEAEARQAELFEQIGRLKMELE